MEPLFASIRYPFCIALLVLAGMSCACSMGKPTAAEKRTPEQLAEDLANGNDDVRIEAIRQLALTKKGSTVPTLEGVLKDSAGRVAVAAATALGDLKNPAASETLWRVIIDPAKTPDVRFAAALALAAIGDSRAAEPLVRGLSYNYEPARIALVNLGKPAVPALIAGLRDAVMRPNASKVLISMGGTGVDALIELLRHGKGDSERRAAAATLAEIPDPRAEDALNEALKNPEPELPWAAYRFLIRKGQPGTEAQLINALNTYGKVGMAEDFSASGNPALKAAAEDWCRKKNYRLAMRSSDMDVVYWGGENPSIKRLGLYHFDHSLTSTSGVAPAQSKGVSFVPGKWASALSVGQDGVLTYPLAGNLSFRDGTIEMWISPKLDGSDPIYSKYNQPLLYYQSAAGDQFLVAETSQGGFYAGSYVLKQFRGAGGGSFTNWKAGTWHHIAFTYSSNPIQQRLYLDGLLLGEGTMPMPEPDPGAGTFAVGCNPFGLSTAFAVDELVISSGARSTREIQSSASRLQPFADR